MMCGSDADEHGDGGDARRPAQRVGRGDLAAEVGQQGVRQRRCRAERRRLPVAGEADRTTSPTAMSAEGDRDGGLRRCRLAVTTTDQTTSSRLAKTTTAVPRTSGRRGILA